MFKAKPDMQEAMLGVSIGNYKIVERVGRGGMGVVYRAVHQILGRSAAVKVLLPIMSNAHEMNARLFNEARWTASIRDAGVVEIYDFGVLPDQTAYILMEFLDGESLSEQLRRTQGVTCMHALQIIRAVSRTLQAAHERGVVHRDLKPGNIFLVPDPELPAGERVKLVDFGLAKHDVEVAKQPLTRSGILMGTPPYMSPEQCRGTGLIDRRTDLYALGCVLYELVCGRPPFIGGGAGEIIAHHLFVSPDPPRNHNECIPQALETLILWLLQKNPDHRPTTAAHVVAAIDDLDVTTMPAMPPRSVLRPGFAAAVPIAPTMTRATSGVGAMMTTARAPRPPACEHRSRDGRCARARGRRRMT
jgi:serine/threonine protein kinase